MGSPEGLVVLLLFVGLALAVVYSVVRTAVRAGVRSAIPEQRHDVSAGDPAKIS